MHLAVPGKMPWSKWKGQVVSNDIYGEEEDEDIKVWA